MLFFQAGGLFSIENARFCPVSVRFVQCWLFFMNLRIFYRTFYRPKKYTGESNLRNIMYDYMKCTTFLYWHTFLGKYQAWQTTRDYGISRVYWLRIDWLMNMGKLDTMTNKAPGILSWWFNVDETKSTKRARETYVKVWKTNRTLGNLVFGSFGAGAQQKTHDRWHCVIIGCGQSARYHTTTKKYNDNNNRGTHDVRRCVIIFFG